MENQNISLKKKILTFLRLIGEFIAIAIIYSLLSQFIFDDQGGLFASSYCALITVLLTGALYVFIQNGAKKEVWRGLFSVSKLQQLLKGLGVGTIYMSLTVGIIALCGCYSIESISLDWSSLYKVLLMFLVVAVGEEILFRGVVYKRLATIFNPIVAIILSGLIFGFVHLGNENATIWSSVAIAIEAGGLLGASYMWSKSLYFPIGIHWAWNFVQGYVYGAGVSGNLVDCFITPNISGNEYITGGDFGPEASVIAVVLGILFTYYFIREASKKKA